jgi:hypothetical protein
MSSGFVCAAARIAGFQSGPGPAARRMRTRVRLWMWSLETLLSSDSENRTTMRVGWVCLRDCPDRRIPIRPRPSHAPDENSRAPVDVVIGDTSELRFRESHNHAGWRGWFRHSQRCGLKSALRTRSVPSCLSPLRGHTARFWNPAVVALFGQCPPLPRRGRAGEGGLRCDRLADASGAVPSKRTQQTRMVAMSTGFVCAAARIAGFQSGTGPARF